jgi:3-hydroxyisobutyrate dehydrogenase
MNLVVSLQKLVHMKAFLGMGLLGSNFVRAMLKKNEKVQIWNRTYSKAADLAGIGASPFESVEDAVRNADTIHLTVKDDDSVNAVLDRAKPALKKGATIIDHTTTSVGGTIERTKKWSALGFNYQHAPVFMGPVNALEGTGYMLISGDQQLIAKLENQLSGMTGKLINFGPEIGRASAMKLIGNCFLVGFTASLGDSLSLAKSLDAPIADVDKLFASWNPASSLTARINRISTDDFSKPSWELNMARKDTGLFMKAAIEADINLMVIPSIADIMDRWIAKGSGEQDWTIITKTDRINHPVAQITTRT